MRIYNPSSFGVKNLRFGRPKTLADRNADIFTGPLEICPNCVEIYTFKKKKKKKKKKENAAYTYPIWVRE